MTELPQPQITKADTDRVTCWHTAGWEAEYYTPYLCLTAPDGTLGLVQLRECGRNVTLAQFRSSVASHGIKRACETFWKLRAQDVTHEAEDRKKHGVSLSQAHKKES